MMNSCEPERPSKGVVMKCDASIPSSSILLTEAVTDYVVTVKLSVTVVLWYLADTFIVYIAPGYKLVSGTSRRHE